LLADFGIATLLATGSVKYVEATGSPAYMAPEQFRGMISKESDQYALGCIAYELFTGSRPFNAPDFVAMAFQHATEPPVPPRQLNPQLPLSIEQAILKAMAKERKDRYPDVASFIAALQPPSTYREPDPVPAPGPIPTPYPIPKPNPVPAPPPMLPPAYRLVLLGGVNLLGWIVLVIFIISVTIAVQSGPSSPVYNLPFFPGVLGLCLFIFSIVTSAVDMIGAFRGRYTRLPLLWKYAEKYADRHRVARVR